MVTEPRPMSRGGKIAYAIGLPLGLIMLVFLPIGRLDWVPGWVFIGFLFVTYGIAASVLLSRLLPAMVIEIPLATLDAGRMHWSVVSPAIVVLGYALLGGGIAFGGWAQAVNRFFEPGVRLQRERGQHVITDGPYRFVRHPGYVSALMVFVGLALALASWWALIPAAWASALLIVRTRWEDALLHAELAGYADYARRTRYRLLPGVW